MGKNLVIVESPAKAKTIEKYLGKRFRGARLLRPRARSRAQGRRGRSRARLRDEVPAASRRTRSTSRRSSRPSRKRMRSISRPTPIAKAKRSRGTSTRCSKSATCSTRRSVHRVVFHEVTKRAIQEAIEQPRKLSEELVNAQQARRALDYLVGFNLSPLLWKKVRRGLSAGRVQSPALRLIVEREDEITAFKAQEYWTIEALAGARAGRGRRSSPRGCRCSAATRSSSSAFTNEAAGPRGRADDPRYGAAAGLRSRRSTRSSAAATRPRRSRPRRSSRRRRASSASARSAR